MIKETIKKAIAEKVIKDDHVSFAEIEGIFIRNNYDYKGSNSIEHSKGKNVVIWCGWTKEAIDLLKDAIDENKLYMQGTPVLTYIIDGMGIDYPIAKSIRVYKNPRWLPMVIRRPNIKR